VLAFLCCALIYLGVEQRRRLRERRARFLSRSVQEWILQSRDRFASNREHGEETGVPESVQLQFRLGTSEIFQDWLVAGPDDRILVKQSADVSFSPTDRRYVRRVRETQDVQIGSDQRIYFPVLRRGGQIFVVATSLKTVGHELSPYDVVLSTVTIMGLGTVLLVLVLYLLYDHLLFNPLSALMDATEKIAEEDYSHRIDTPDRDDEIGELISAFNRMTGELETFHNQLQEKVDRTRKKMKQTQRNLMVAQRLSSMGTLASGIAHEINNPLGGMLNAVRSLKRRDLSEEKQEEYLQLIRDGLERIRRIVGRVLEFAPSRDRVEVKEMNLNETIDSIRHLEKHRIEDLGITVQTDTPDDPVRIQAAPMEIQQALFNVFKNAIDAVSENEPDEPMEIRVSVRVRDDEDEAVVDVTDTGPGMSDQMRDRAFDPFYTSKNDGDGSGLGLSIAHRIVQNHGGTIEIHDTSENGTSIRVYLPRHCDVRESNEQE